MSYENLFIGDFSDEQKNKIYLKEPLDANTVKFEKDGFTIKLENGVELIHVENGIVIRVADHEFEAVKVDFSEFNYSGLPVAKCPTCGSTKICHLYGVNYCPECGQKLDWED